MTGNTQSDGGSDRADSLVRGLVDALSESGATTGPMASTDADEVIKSQLTENTGRHLLDSGIYGRHWEENQDNPPWEQPAWNVHRDYISHNVFHYLSERFERDYGCVALEAALYAHAHSDTHERDPWRPCMESFAEAILRGHFTVPDLVSLDVPEEAANTVVGLSQEIRRDRRDDEGPVTHNTYNSEFHELSQVLQGTNIGGPYSEYVLLQVHGGADVRGGYTAPRVYKQTHETWWPGELWFHCDRCGWDEAESCCWDDEALIFQPEPDYEEVAEHMIETRPDGVSDHDARQAAVQIVNEGHEKDHQDGAVFHRCDDAVGHVRFS